MLISTTKSYDALVGAKRNDFMCAPIDEMQRAISQLPQYEPETNHYFHGGMYCREVKRCEGALIIGKVHKKEHFYVIVSGTVAISQEGEPAKQVTGPCVIKSMPGTKRAVLAITDAVCMTFHRVDCQTVDEAEKELVEEDPASMFDAFNRVKQEVLK